MLVNVNGIYYVHVCEQAYCAHSVRNSAIESSCILIIFHLGVTCMVDWALNITCMVDWALNITHLLCKK